MMIPGNMASQLSASCVAFSFLSLLTLIYYYWYRYLNSAGHATAIAAERDEEDDGREGWSWARL